MNEEAPANSKLGPYYTRIILGDYKRPKPFDKSEFIPNTYIFLPIPSELRDDTNVSWSTDNLETVGDVLNGQVAGGVEAALLRNSGKIITATAGVFSDAAGALADTAGVGGAFDRGADIVSNLFPASQITSAVQTELGFAPNPNPVASFQGPDLRSYAFSWTFYPHNAEESKNTKILVEKLKARSLASNVLSKSASVLKFPNMVQVNFFPWDKGGRAPWYWSENSITRYKRSIMQSVNINYAPFGTPGFFAGTNLPTTIQLSISFKEIEYMLANDWDPSFEGNSSITSQLKAVGGSLKDTAKGALDQIKSGIASL